MPIPPLRLLIKTSNKDSLRFNAGKLTAAGVVFHTEPLFKFRPPEERLGFGTEPQWFVAVSPEGAENAWDAAHLAVADGFGLGLAPGFSYAEPDLVQEWPWPYTIPDDEQALAAQPPCTFIGQDSFWPQGPRFAWHLDDDFTGLRSARAFDHSNVRIGHIDTGYREHVTTPKNINKSLQWNFIENNDDVTDTGDKGFLKNPGHGTSTMALLAGNKLEGLRISAQNTGQYLGGAPDAEIVPMRIATSVVQFLSSALAQAIDYAVAPRGDRSRRCDVISISMGGVPSGAWTDAVNRAYEAGVCIVAAAGNNMTGGLINSIVYPARYGRVIAACGMTAEGSPYYRKGSSEMQGNFGPSSKMKTAVAAYTPNTPYAPMNCRDLIREDGAGTSGSTPQVAAAAALWLAKHNPQYDEPWKRVEAVRYALFSTAAKNFNKNDKYFGNGVIRAAASLQVQPAAYLQKAPPSSIISNPFSDGIGLAPAQTEMMRVEVAQLLQKSETLAGILEDPDVPAPESSLKTFMQALVEEKQASQALRRYAEGEYVRRFKTFPAGAPARRESAVSAVSEVRPPQSPPFRRLRGHAFDPSFSNSLDTAALNEVTFKIRWEDDLKPGPSGEYLEVIDYDSVSHQHHDPVDLNHPYLLAQKGLQPSEGNPQFHQQMVYAVAMTTIEHFERALGRRVQWAARTSAADGNSDDASVFVQRLKVYPHAFQQQNAFYSPENRSLLFGYFRARSADLSQQYPGSMTFTSLSHDIVTHETTHAILDGIHRRLTQPTNPDTLAFHEAFADIVALFQHFGFPEAVHDQLAKTRGDLSSGHLLADLARQFGTATGMRGALRSAIGQDPSPAAYQQAIEPHTRGAILVATVFDAFVRIYNLRTADLLRIASDGTGVVRPGRLPGDLVNRLAAEANTAARQVLDICIRALDYCPPVDLTFGDYLRALVTADYDLVRDDQFGYRLAFLEAFRRRGIYPLDVPTLSIESLRWQTVAEDSNLADSAAVNGIVQTLRTYAEKCSYVSSRQTLFGLTVETRKNLGEQIKKILESDARRDTIAGMLGLDMADGLRGISVHSLRVAQRVRADRTAGATAFIEITQGKRCPLDESNPALGSFEFLGGSTLAVDLRGPRLRYVVTKNINAQQRLERTRAYLKGRSAVDLGFYSGQEPFAFLHTEAKRVEAAQAKVSTA